MLRFNNEQKDKINILLNIDNFYGKYTGGLGRILLYCVAVCVPFLLYTIVLVNLIPFKIFMLVFIPYAIRMAFLIIGREKERMVAYLKQRNDEYASAKELIRIADVHDDGLIEYTNGFICYIIQAYGYSYMDDNSYSKDLEEFLSRLTNKYEVDIYGHVVVGELGTTQEDMEKLRVYTDQEFLQERLDFYKYQDRYSDENSKLYRLNFVVRSYKNNWGKFKKELATLISSEYVQCFDDVKICDRDEAIDVVSRDICLYVDVGEMLRNKHSSDNFYGSKVLYFGDNIPEDLKPKENKFEDENERRVIDDN